MVFLDRNISEFDASILLSISIQVARAILENPNDVTKVHLIYANVTSEDILLKVHIYFFFVIQFFAFWLMFGAAFVSVERHISSSVQNVHT